MMNLCERYILNAFSCSLICLTAATLLASCSSNPAGSTPKEVPLEGHWQAEGLEGTNVTVLKNDGDGLLVGTEQGLFRRSESDYARIGLREHEVVGVVRLKDGGLLASVQSSDFVSGDTTLFRSQDDGASWEPFMNNFGGDGEKKYTWIDSGPVAASPGSDTLFTRGNVLVARSVNGGQGWTVTRGQWDLWGGFGALIKADPMHPGLIWAGGRNAFSLPYLSKSTDYGESWKELESISETNSEVKVEGTVYDVVTHPEAPNRVLVAMRGVRRSTDGGGSWKSVFADAGIHAFARSIRHPGVIYASGRDDSARPFFAVTTDFGETWEKKTFKEGPSPVTTSDLAVMMIEGQEVLFLGTDQGLFSFRFE